MFKKDSSKTKDIPTIVGRLKNVIDDERLLSAVNRLQFSSIMLHRFRLIRLFYLLFRHVLCTGSSLPGWGVAAILK